MGARREMTVTIVPWILALAACAGQVEIRSDFEGGCIDGVRRVSETRFVCRVPGQADHEGRNRQVSWYFFRVDGARGREVEITLTDLVGEYNYRPGAVAITEETIPVCSDDGRNWRHFDSVWYDKEKKHLTLRFTPRSDAMWIAHVEPYTASRIARAVDELRGRPHVRVESIGRSVRGRVLTLVTVTNPAVPDEGKKVLWFMFRQHAWETGTSFAAEGLLDFIASDEPEARRLRDRAIFKVFPTLDPDGCAEGGIRFNRNGYDLNRNWYSCDLSSDEHRRLMPEIWHSKKAMADWLDSGRRIDFFVTLHNEEKGEWMSGSEEFGDLAARFFNLLRESPAFDPGQAGPRPQPKRPAPGRMTVYEYLLLERRVPAFLIELRITRSAKLGRPPTSADRIRFGRDLAWAAARAVLD